jgi:peptide/nickel transport system substrate-binding protein
MSYPIRRYAAQAATTVLVTALMPTGCSASKSHAPPAGSNAEVGTTSDINPQDPATLREGGRLRLTLAEFPSNYNALHIDGTRGDNVNMQKATLPRAFIIDRDGSMQVTGAARKGGLPRSSWFVSALVRNAGVFRRNPVTEVRRNETNDLFA